MNKKGMYILRHTAPTKALAEKEKWNAGSVNAGVGDYLGRAIVEKMGWGVIEGDRGGRWDEGSRRRAMWDAGMDKLERLGGIYIPSCPLG